ncbi:MAG: glycosyltransferase family 4 protein [Anaerolineae bacterium]|nr:glycosyltransferase family 4 protein [Anaerolineae bacterium]
MVQRIGIDVCRIGKQRTGIENFALSVVKALSALTRDHADWEFHLFATDDGTAVIRGALQSAGTDRLRIHNVTDDGGRGGLKEQVYLPHATRNLPTFDLFYSPGYPLSPLVRSQMTIQQVHDMVPWRYGDTMTAGARLYWRVLLPVAIRRSRIVATDSQFTMDELRSFRFGKYKSMRIVHVSIDDRYLDFCAAGSSSILAELQVSKPYLLILGSLEPRKNLLFLLDVFERYHQMNHTVNLQLVIAGGKGWKNKQFFDKISAHPFQSQVRLIGWVNEDHLQHLVAGAEALLYPSLYEGFGLPPLEAIAVGTPVVASNAAAIPEIMGEHALYADPRNVDEWVQRLVYVVGNSEYREWIKLRGRTWAARYSQAALTDVLDHLFAEVLPQKSR